MSGGRPLFCFFCETHGGSIVIGPCVCMGANPGRLPEERMIAMKFKIALCALLLVMVSTTASARFTSEEGWTGWDGWDDNSWGWNRDKQWDGQSCPREAPMRGQRLRRTIACPLADGCDDGPWRDGTDAHPTRQPTQLSDRQAEMTTTAVSCDAAVVASTSNSNRRHNRYRAHRPTAVSTCA